MQPTSEAAGRQSGPPRSALVIPTLHEGYVVSVHRMVMENRPVDRGRIQGSHRLISFIRIKHGTRANDFFVKLSNNHIAGLVRKNHIINEI